MYSGSRRTAMAAAMHTFYDTIVESALCFDMI